MVYIILKTIFAINTCLLNNVNRDLLTKIHCIRLRLMDAKELTRIFWNNVDSLKKTKGMTWEDLEAETEHSARSIATMKTMNKAPSFHFALAIAKALGTTVENLASKTNNKSMPEGTMRDVLYKICDKLNENDIFMLACVAKSISESMQAEDSQSLDDAMEAMKRRYL